MVLTINERNNNQTQNIFLIRHGVAQHNIHRNHRDLKNDERFTDPKLIPEGIQQIVAKNIPDMLPSNIDLVVVSPLTRCIQTSLVIFPPYGNRRKKIICREDLREACGIYFPDKRNRFSNLSNQFPMLEFDNTGALADEDTYWKPNNRETIHELRNRVISFFNWLATKKADYKNIVVVTHGVWMETCFYLYCPHVLEHSDGSIRRVHNGDVFYATLNSDSGQLTNAHLLNI